MLGIFNLGEITRVKTGDDGTFRHDKVDVRIVLGASMSGHSVISKFSDDTAVFVLFVYWVNLGDIQCWDGSVLDTNAICADLGQ